MSKIIKTYRTIGAKTLKDLQDTVNTTIKRGEEPLGGVTFLGYSTEVEYPFIQTVVEYETKEENTTSCNKIENTESVFDKKEDALPTSNSSNDWIENSSIDKIIEVLTTCDTSYKLNWEYLWEMCPGLQRKMSKHLFIMNTKAYNNWECSEDCYFVESSEHPIDSRDIQIHVSEFDQCSLPLMTRILSLYPEHFKHFNLNNLNRLTGEHWAVILATNPYEPRIMKYFEEWGGFAQLHTGDWVRLLRSSHSDHFAEKFNFSTLEGVFLYELLIKKPQYADRCNVKCLDGNLQYSLLLNRPELISYLDLNEMVKTHAKEIISLFPKVLDTLDINAVVCDQKWILDRYPRFAEHLIIKEDTKQSTID